MIALSWYYSAAAMVALFSSCFIVDELMSFVACAVAVVLGVIGVVTGIKEDLK